MIVFILNNNYCKYKLRLFITSVPTIIFLNSASFLNITGMKCGVTKTVRIINALANNVVITLHGKKN